jgi:hypothetical protein
MKITIRNLFLVILFCGIFYISMKPIADPDFWWHLRTGQLIEQTREIPRMDPFSFSANGKPWIAHEWLSELLFFLSYQLGGYQLLIPVFALIIAASFFFAYLRCPKESRPYIAGYTLLLGFLTALPPLGVRPQVITVLFTSIFLYILDLYRKNEKLRTLIALPLIMLLWVNMHAGYILGLVIEIVYIGGWVIELLITKFWKKEKINPATIRSLLILIGAFVVTLLTVPINPAGFRIFTFSFQIFFDPAIQSFVQEWVSPDFHMAMWLPFVFILLALIGSGMIGSHPVSITKIILTLGFGFAALRSARHVPLFAIAVVPVLAEQLSSLIKFRPVDQAPSRLLRWLNTILVVVVAIALVMKIIQLPEKQIKTEADNFPVNAVNWILKNKPAGNIFNTFNWGGYLIWRLYPEYLVYIDGRPDMYGTEFMTDYIEIHFADPGWEEKLDHKNVQLVFVESDSYLARAIQQSMKWEIIYEDQQGVLFSKK